MSLVRWDEDDGDDTANTLVRYEPSSGEDSSSDTEFLGCTSM